jgi:acyl-CoA thioesterase FadM
MKTRPGNAALWGGSIALSWMWGLGLFFSVQFTFQFGLFGLLSFAIPNAIGLFSFGAVTAWIAKRQAGANSLDPYFAKLVRPFRLVFFLYQILAITLTIFALLRYLFEALDLSRPALVLPLTVLIVLATACLFGEEFNIRRIKYSHGVMLTILLTAVAILLFSLRPFETRFLEIPGSMPAEGLNFWGFVIPLVVGLLIGPWLDLQQWQRAIQIQKEKTSIALSYFLGAGLFFCLLIFHGIMTLWAMGNGGQRFSYEGIDGIAYAHDIITRLMATAPWSDSFIIPWSYYIFLGICALTTLDSGYLALRWFLKENLKDYKIALLNLVPNQIVISPIPSLIFAGVFSLFATVVGLELEYYMVFFATFFVGYGAMLITRCFTGNEMEPIPQIRMFSMGSLAVVIFAFGYFLRQPLLLIFGSLLPAGYILWLLFGTVNESDDEVASVVDHDDDPTITPDGATLPGGGQLVPTESTVVPLTAYEGTGEHFEDKWFVHSFRATYADTNSTGNVYFGMYAMWVGKARELFFHHAMPQFEVKTTPYFILTRSFEHKFIRETREFERVQVKIRVSDFNRKFVTLEHQIFDSSNQLLGKGKQSLLFVSSKDYGLLDIPQEVLTSFMPYT